jgi:integrase/recombinase XerD
MESGQDADADYTISNLAPLFLDWARYEMRRAPWTIVRYRECLRTIVRLIGDVPVTRLHQGHLLRLRQKLEERGCKEARVAGLINALRSFLKFCQEVLRVRALDYREIRVPRVPRRDVVYLTPDEVRMFVEAIISPEERLSKVSVERLRLRTFVEVLLGTGARLSEALSLNRADVNFERREAKIIGKGNKERLLFFTERSLEWVERYLARRDDEGEALFIAHADPPRRLERTWFKDTFSVYRRKAGIEKRVTPHILRHTMATTLLFNGCPIGHIKEVLGHERLDTTCRYYLGLDRRAAREAHGKFLTY